MVSLIIVCAFSVSSLGGSSASLAFSFRLGLHCKLMVSLFRLPLLCELADTWSGINPCAASSSLVSHPLTTRRQGFLLAQANVTKLRPLLYNANAERYTLDVHSNASTMIVVPMACFLAKFISHHGVGATPPPTINNI